MSGKFIWTRDTVSMRSACVCVCLDGWMTGQTPFYISSFAVRTSRKLARQMLSSATSSRSYRPYPSILLFNFVLFYIKIIIYNRYRYVCMCAVFMVYATASRSLHPNASWHLATHHPFTQSYLRWKNSSSSKSDKTKQNILPHARQEIRIDTD